MFTRSIFSSLMKWIKRLVLTGFILTLLLLMTLAFLLREGIYNRFVVFPRQAEAWSALRSSHQQVALDDGWEDYRGVCHSHSHLSHDSEVSFEAVLDAAKEANLQFIFMSDHCTDNQGDFSAQWRGMYDGVLFAPGFETSSGLLVWGLPSEVTFDCGEERETLVPWIVERGGTVFFAHTEEERPYELEQVSGMEIYNIHTDLKDESYSHILGNVLFGHTAYPDLSLYSVYDRQEAILALWDKVNQTGDWTGISANDAHQNVGLIGVLSPDHRLNLLSTSHDPVGSLAVGTVGAALLGTLFGHDGEGQIFRLDFDPYARSLRFVNMHLLARELTEPALLEALREGRGYVGFDMIADSSGFVFFGENGDTKAVMGEEITLDGSLTLRVAAPQECRFRLLRDGVLLEEVVGREAAWTPTEVGKYRVEADLKVLDGWVSWVFTNPLTVVPAPAGAGPGLEAAPAASQEEA